MKYVKIKTIITVLAAMLLLAGCATTKAEYDSNGELLEPVSYGKCSVGKYTGLTAKETTLPVTDEDIEISMEYWRNRGDETPDDELREKCRRDLEISMKNASKEQVIDELLDQIIAKSTFSINEIAVEYQYQELKKYYNEFAEYNGMTLENFIAMYGTDETSFDKEVKQTARNIVKDILVKQAIFEKEGMELSKEEMVDKKNVISDKVKDFLYNNSEVSIE